MVYLLTFTGQREEKLSDNVKRVHKMTLRKRKWELTSINSAFYLWGNKRNERKNKTKQRTVLSDRSDSSNRSHTYQTILGGKKYLWYWSEYAWLCTHRAVTSTGEQQKCHQAQQARDNDRFPWYTIQVWPRSQVIGQRRHHLRKEKIMTSSC